MGAVGGNFGRMWETDSCEAPAYSVQVSVEFVLRNFVCTNPELSAPRWRPVRWPSISPKHSTFVYVCGLLCALYPCLSGCVWEVVSCLESRFLDFLIR